jgi:hypothetical protein
VGGAASSSPAMENFGRVGAIAINWPSGPRLFSLGTG